MIRNSFLQHGGRGSAVDTARGDTRLPVEAVANSNGDRDGAGLRRTMNDTQRYGKSNGNETGIAGLRPNGEPVTFYCSHCAPLTRRLWLGARSVFPHWRVPFAYFLPDFS